MDGETAWLSTAAYFVALVNPASKILILSSMQQEHTAKELRRISIRSTMVAASILLVLTVAGNFILGSIFHVDLYSLKIAGGIILFMIGLLAVRKGVFYESVPGNDKNDVSIVPLAAPLIVGPGTITGAISFASEHGIATTLLSAGIALLFNLLLMLFSPTIGKCLGRLNATGPLIRITGLIVAAVAIQMVLGGLGAWFQSVMPR